MARESFKPTPGGRNFMQKLPDSADDIPERVLVDLDGKDDKFEIVVKDDTPEDERGSTEWNAPSNLDVQEDELRSLSGRAQKRIQRMRAEIGTLQRAESARVRELDAAAELLRSKDEELARLRKVAESGTTALVASMKAEREARVADAQRRLSSAHADGDNDGIAKATSDLSQAQAELVQIAAQAPRSRPAQEQQTPAQQQPPQQRGAPPVLAPNVAGWIDKQRDWWGRDKDKTDFALAAARRVEARGIPPSDPSYTREVDKALKAVYPDHDDGYRPSDDDDGGRRSTPRRTNAVTEGSREGAEGATPDLNSRKVELTQSEVSLAQRMRIPLAKYADEKRKRLLAEKGGAP